MVSDTPASARAIAAAPTAPVDGAEGAFAMQADAASW